MNIPNLLMQQFVPQKSLLNHKKVNIFVTHCGGNSILEAQYFGKATVGVPQDADQFANCEKAVILGMGVHLSNKHTSEQFADNIKTLVYDKENEILENADRIRRMMEFEEKNSRNLSYYVALGQLYGLDHLYLQEGHYLGDWVLQYDVDIVCYLAGALFVTLYVLKGILCGNSRRK